MRPIRLTCHPFLVLAVLSAIGCAGGDTDPADKTDETSVQPTDTATTPDPTGGDTSSTPTADTTPDPTGDTATTPTGDTAGTDPADWVPTNATDLLPYLQAETYAGFAAESSVRPATAGSPHGNVRVFLNPILDVSLAAGDKVHPEGAAAVKELYNGNGSARIGWAVSVKTQADSAGGNGWYWYEIINGNVFADGNGEGGCFGCHAATGLDYVSTPYPLQ